MNKHIKNKHFKFQILKKLKTFLFEFELKKYSYQIQME